MRVKKLDHCKNPFAIDAIERAPCIGDRPIIRRPPRTSPDVTGILRIGRSVPDEFRRLAEREL
jgi:hypothetical protein